MNNRLKLISALLLTTSAWSASAKELNYNIYQLSTTAEQQVKNDIMKVTLNASHQAQESAAVHQEVNKQMTAALKQLKSTSDIDYQTGNYQTHPTYKNQKITGWQASQQLELKSKDVSQLTEVVGQLQQQLKVSTMAFQVSKSLRKQTQKNLSIDALNQFKDKALLIQTTMGADSYNIVNVHVNTGGHIAPGNYPMVRAQMSMMADRMPAPAVESGKSEISVTVSGQIQLVFN